MDVHSHTNVQMRLLNVTYNTYMSLELLCLNLMEAHRLENS